MMMNYTLGGYSKQSKTGYIRGYFEPHFIETPSPLTRVTRRKAVTASKNSGPGATINFRTTTVTDGTHRLEVDLGTAFYTNLGALNEETS